MTSRVRSNGGGATVPPLLSLLLVLGACGGDGADAAGAGDGADAAGTVDAAGGPGDRPPRPDVFLVVVDTVRADHLSCYGYERETTPGIDRLARDAVLYEDARSTAPWTLPAHASMFTGLMPGRHGLHWASLDRRPGRRDGGERRLPVVRRRGRLLARVLRDAGYTTIGITNNGWVGSDTGLDEGFDHFHEYFELAKEMRAEQPGWPAEHRVPDELADRDAGGSVALFKKLMDERAVDGPVFASLISLAPLFPSLPGRSFRGGFDADPELLRTMRRRGGEMERSLLAGGETVSGEALARCYDETLRSVDAAVGHLLEWLRDQGLYDDALIVVTSDHGECLGEDGRYSHQLTVRRELLSVPLLVKYPGNVRAGERVSGVPVSVADVYPTILAAALGDGERADGGEGDRDDERGDERDDERDDGRDDRCDHHRFTLRRFARGRRRRRASARPGATRSGASPAIHR